MVVAVTVNKDRQPANRSLIVGEVQGRVGMVVTVGWVERAAEEAMVVLEVFFWWSREIPLNLMKSDRTL